MEEAAIATFRTRVLEWAKKSLAEEVRTDFRRAQVPDSPTTRELLCVLRRQPAENLKILAEVLPLEVFWETPDSAERRNKLSPSARDAVQRFRDDYDREVRQHFDQHVKIISRRNDPRLKVEFRAAVRLGNPMIMGIADRWKCGVTGAGPGEWGLVFETGWGTITVSLNLGRVMMTGYCISIRGRDMVTIRSGHNYLFDLGIGGGEWIVESADDFPKKLQQASEFAWWHLNEYRKIIRKLQDEGIWPGD